MTGAALTRILGPFRLRTVAIAAFALLLLGAAANVAMTPRTRMSDSRDFDLERLIPERFGDWTRETPQNVVLPDPEAQRLVNKIYNVVLTRSYRNADGKLVMLVIAYGGDQSDALQLHRPEVCYAASGYSVKSAHFDDVELAGRELLITRVETRSGFGFEPVSYWMRVGARQVTTNMDRQLAKLTDGLRGIIPDGVLVRISTRTQGDDIAADFAVQDQFVADLLSSLDEKTRDLLVGTGAGARAQSTKG